MSVDSKPAELADPDRRPDERREQDRRRLKEARSRASLGLLAALLAVLAASAFGWREVRLERALQGEQVRAARSGTLEAQDLERLTGAVAALEERSQRSAQALTELATLRSQQAELGRSLSAIEERLAQPQRALARAEAGALVVLAQRRLDLDRDVPAAVTLFEAADRALAPYKDEPDLGARAQLARDLAALREVPTPDLRAIAVRLARAEDSVAHLPLLGTVKSEYTRPNAHADESGLARAWRRFVTEFNQLVAVRRVSDAAVELISLEEADVRRHHLEALLFATRLAALRADEPEYALGLKAAREWLGRFFDGRDARAAELGEELESLARTSIAPKLPDVSRSVLLLKPRAP
jgi:uroporphyrin-III C-methyltransferase